jgi:uncharacterized membrane protein
MSASAVLVIIGWLIIAKMLRITMFANVAINVFSMSIISAKKFRITTLVFASLLSIGMVNSANIANLICKNGFRKIFANLTQKENTNVCLDSVSI